MRGNGRSRERPTHHTIFVLGTLAGVPERIAFRSSCTMAHCGVHVPRFHSSSSAAASPRTRRRRHQGRRCDTRSNVWRTERSSTTLDVCCAAVVRPLCAFGSGGSKPVRLPETVQKSAEGVDGVGKLEKFSAETFPRAIRLCHTQQGLCDWVALTSSSRSSSTSARMPVLSGARGGRLLAGTAVGRAPSRRVGRGDVRSRRRKVRLRVQPMGRRFRERTMTTNGRTLTTCAMRDPRNR